MYRMTLAQAARKAAPRPARHKFGVELIASAGLLSIASVLGFTGGQYLADLTEWLWDQEAYWMRKREAAELAIQEADENLAKIAEAKRQAEQEQNSGGGY